MSSDIGRRVYEWSRAAAGNASRKKFLALPASKKFHINHREATSSSGERAARETQGGTRQKLPTLLNSVCVRAYGVITSRLPPNATYSRADYSAENRAVGYYEATSVP